MPTVIGVDPGLLGTGVAVIDGTSIQKVFSLTTAGKTGKKQRDTRDRIAEMLGLIAPIIEPHPGKLPDLVIVEVSKSTFQSVAGGGGLASIISTITLGAAIYGYAIGRGAKAALLTASNWMKGDQRMRHEEARERYQGWPKRTNTHTRDAIAIADYGMRVVLGVDVPLPKRMHYLDMIKLPPPDPEFLK